MSGRASSPGANGAGGPGDGGSAAAAGGHSWRDGPRIPKRRAGPEDGARAPRKVPRVDPRLLRDAVPLAARPRPRSRWDEHAKGYEHVSAEQIRLSGVYRPGMRLDPTSMPPELAAIVNVPPLAPRHSSWMGLLVVRGADPREHLAQAFKRLGLEPVEFKWWPGPEVSLLQLPSAKHAALALALAPPETQLARAPGLVTSASGSIYSSSRTKYVTGLAPDATPDTVKALYPDMTSKPMLVLDTEGKCMGAAFALFEEAVPENAHALFPELNPAAPALEKDDARVADFAKLANEAVEGQVPKTRTLQLLNALDDGESSAEVLADIADECAQFGPAEVAVLAPPGLLPRVLVRFLEPEQCSAALAALGGRLYSNRPLIAATVADGVWDLGLAKLWK